MRDAVREHDTLQSRRSFLLNTGMGLGATALASLVLHAVLVAALTVNWISSEPEVVKVKPAPKVINARLVDVSEFQPKPKPKPKPKAQPKPKPRVVAKPVPAKPKPNPVAKPKPKPAPTF